MNCAQHPDRPSAVYCRTCGKALCEACKREIRQVSYCEDCLAGRVQPEMPAAGLPPRPGGGPHPALAGILSVCLPFGVGPVYNGLYSRGLVYLVIFIALTWGCNQGEAAAVVFGIAMAAFYFWQVIDSIRSARYLQAGLPAPDPFGVDRLFGEIGNARPPVPGDVTPPPAPVAPPPAAAPAAAPPVKVDAGANVPLYAVFLIVLGMLFLLGNLGLFHMHWLHLLWPMLLIVLGGWTLQARWAEIIASPEGRRRLMGPAILLTLGTGFLVKHLFGLSIWLPLLLIVIGLVLVWQRTPPAGPPSGTTPQSNPTVGQNPER